MQIYMHNQRSYNMLKALNQIQDHATTAIDIFASAIHQAGFIGCAKLTQDFPIYAQLPDLMHAQNKLTGTDKEITVRYLGYPSSTLEVSMQNNSTLYVTNEKHFSRGDTVLISDCQQAEVFVIKEVYLFKNRQKIIAAQSLHKRYGQHADIGPLEVNKFFISKTHRTHPDGTPIYSLFIKQSNKHKFELVAEIDQMRFIYYFFENDRLTKRRADEIHNWSKIAGLGISIMLHSPPINKNWYTYFSVGIHE